MIEIDTRIDRLRSTVEQLLSRVEQLPHDVLYREPQPGEWPVMSTLAHLSELLPYWAQQAASIAQTPGLAFGRALDDPDRLGAIEHHGRDTLGQSVVRVRTSLEQSLSTLRAIPPDAWSHAGEHPRRGRMTVADVVDAFLLEHAQEHAAQIEATLHALGAPQR